MKRPLLPALRARAITILCVIVAAAVVVLAHARLLAVLLLIGLCAGCAAAHPEAPLGGAAFGYTSCQTGEPVYWIRQDVLDNDTLLAQVRAHETEHVRHTRARGGCHAQIWRRTPRLQREARAYCAELRLFPADSLLPVRRADRLRRLTVIWAETAADADSALARAGC